MVESHQRTKVDTSGTAKAIVQSFKNLGVDFSEVSMPRKRAAVRGVRRCRDRWPGSVCGAGRWSCYVARLRVLPYVH